MDDWWGVLGAQGRGRGVTPKRSLLPAAGDVSLGFSPDQFHLFTQSAVQLGEEQQQHNKQRDADAITDKRVTWSPSNLTDMML